MTSRTGTEIVGGDSDFISLVEKLRDKLGSGIVLLCGVGSDKVALLAMVSKDLTGRFHAGNRIGALETSPETTLVYGHEPA